VSARFCSNCGIELLTVFDAGRPDRRPVTVLFTDVTGFTDLSERLDPERLQPVMSRYFDEMRSVVESHGGTVEKFIGDAVVAVFGIPHLHEDDALRAVRAAVEMHGRLVTLNRELQQAWGVTIELHTGINTGEVATRGRQLGQGPVLGDAVNVAARLQQLAPAGEILLGETTHQLVQGMVEAEVLDPLQVKGRGELVHAVRLRGLSHESAGRGRRLNAPMIGREQELGMLRQTIEQVATDRHPWMVTVLGAPGVGKTRLTEELILGLKGSTTVLKGYCLPYGQGITFRPVAQALKQACGIADQDSDDDARAKIAALVEGQDDAPLVAERAAQVLGLARTTTAAEDVYWGVRKVLEGLASRGPVLVVLEDLHWAEPALLDLVEHVRDWSRDAGIAVLCVARPELLDQRPSWGEPGQNTSVLRLEPLNQAASDQVISHLLGELAERPRARIRNAAEGNPLYLGELVTALIQRGALHPQSGRWVATTDLSEIKIPPTIQALLASRLDRLAPGPRQVIEAASVIGVVFGRDDLINLLGDRGALDVDHVLGTLVEEELVQRLADGSDVDAYRFHHGLIREAAYGGVSKESRAELHERVADRLERGGRRLGEHEEVLGFHLESAFRYHCELRPVDEHARRLADRSGEHLAAAGCAAFNRGDMLATVNLLSRATALLPEGAERRLSVLPNLIEALMGTGQFDSTGALLADAHAAARRAGDRGLEAHVLLIRSVQKLFTDPHGGAEAAREEVGRTIPVFEELKDDLGLARSWRVLGIVHAMWAQFSEGERAMDLAAGHARRAGDRRAEVEALSWIPLFNWCSPARPEEGLARGEQVRDRAQGDLQVDANVLLAKGSFEALQGHFAEARDLAGASRLLLEDLGLRVSIAGPWSQFAAWIELLAGDAGAAAEMLRGAYESLVEMGESGWLSTVVGLLAEALWREEQYEEAEQFTRVSEASSASDDLYSQVLWRSVRGKVAAARGEHEVAEELVRGGVRLSKETDFLQLRGDALMNLAEVLRLHERPRDAEEYVAQAMNEYARKGSAVSVERARSALAGLR
jgi:class 3 adenylate cyclase/tetratricopeptide (TPR) repeat protein